MGAPRGVGRAGGGRRGRPNTGPRVPGPAVCARCEVARALAGAAGGQGPRRAVEARGSRENFYVPSDSFGGLSPERKAAMAMKNLFTMCAVKIVLAQLEDSSAGRGGSAQGGYNPEACQTIYDHLEEVELRDGDEWLALLMKKDRMLALRLLEVREAYARTGFEWDNMVKASLDVIEKANISILREGAERMLGDGGA